MSGVRKCLSPRATRATPASGQPLRGGHRIRAHPQRPAEPVDSGSAQRGVCAELHRRPHALGGGAKCFHGG
eukprot:1954691-Alexandrium_andersonii.AAC.1